MIPKLIIILLLTIEYIFSEETTIHEKHILHTPTIGTEVQKIERIAEERNAGLKSTTNNSRINLNGSTYQLQQKSGNGGQTQRECTSLPSTEELNTQLQETVDDLDYHPIVRYETQNNHNQVRGQIVLCENEGESRQLNTQQQSRNKTKGKSKGFIEFEFDIDDDVKRRENIEEPVDEIKPSSSSLKQILTSIFPQSIADLFRLSYVAKPQSRARHTVHRHKLSKSMQDNEGNLKIVALLSSPQTNSEYPHVSLRKDSEAITKKNSNMVTNDDIREINNAVDSMQAISILVNQNFSELVSPFGEPINAENISDSDYEDQNINLDDDNLIASSKVSSSRIFYPHASEIELDKPRGLHKNQLSSLEKQINVQIIQDTLGGYGQRIVTPQTRHLDDFQEEVEKQFSPNDINRDSEAPSRKFLRNFKEKISNKNQSNLQTRRLQPGNLLQTNVHSSDNTNNSFTEYEAPPAGSLLQSSSSNLEVRHTEEEETKETKEESPLHTHGFLYNTSNKIFVTLGTKNDIDGFIQSTTPYSRYNYKPPTIVEIQKSVNIHNKFITENNGSLVEQHEIYLSPEHLQSSPSHLQLLELNTQPSLSENPIRVAQAEESLQSEAFVYPEIKFNFQQDSTHQQQIQQNNIFEESYQKNDNLYQSQGLSTGQQRVQNIQNQQNRYQHLQQQNYQPIQQEIQQGPQYQQSLEHEYQNQKAVQIKQRNEKDLHLQEYENQPYQQKQYNPDFELQQKESGQYNQQQENKHQNEQLQLEEAYHYKQHQEQVQGKGQIQQQQQKQNIRNDRLHEHYQLDYAIFDQSQTGQQHQNESQKEKRDQESLNSTKQRIETLIPYDVDIERILQQPQLYPVKNTIKKIIDRPYPVREVVEKIIDHSLPIEEVIDRPLQIPYPVQVDHFIDRPYPVQVPIPVAVPVPVHRYIDRPYPVEKIIEKPIHIPYPVERVVEKVVEKHVPVEVQRFIEKPVETVVEKQVDLPVPVKQFIAHPMPIPIPVPAGVPVAINLSKTKDKTKSLSNNILTDTQNDFLTLVPPPLPSAAGINEYKTITENMHILLINDFNRPLVLDHQFIQWNQPVKRGASTRNVKRSPEFGRNLRVEYGFKPPLVPSLEIDDQGLPVSNVKDL